ncbi:RNA polymerase sigma factor [Rossellomorea aquimaris]|uniref:RNA polymerase sigma factor n=1 Tax=Rossellomorea aquimaris TaxID=189382 RepID=UPI0007D0B4D0|nr:RNA polymerase sigma factor [Rossellomorea aquimaris]
MNSLQTKPSPLPFEEMYHQFHNLIYHIAFKITRDAYLSEDIVQETFLKAYKKMDTLLDPGKIKSWLTSIANSTAIDFIRKESKRNEMYIDQEKNLNDIQCLHGGNHIESEIDALFLKKAIQENIALLPPTQQEVMSLKVTYDLSDSEIALKLNLSPSTVKTRYHRGRKQLYSMVCMKQSA